MSGSARFKEGDRVRFHSCSTEPHADNGREGTVVQVTAHGQLLSYGYGVKLENGLSIGAAEYELELVKSAQPHPV